MVDRIGPLNWLPYPFLPNMEALWWQKDCHGFLAISRPYPYMYIEQTTFVIPVLYSSYLTKYNSSTAYINNAGHHYLGNSSSNGFIQLLFAQPACLMYPPWHCRISPASEHWSFSLRGRLAAGGHWFLRASNVLSLPSHWWSPQVRPCDDRRTVMVFWL